jgi:hypothetical protein
MPLAESWVDRLFARLTLRYGTAFMRQYGDLDPSLVKADWSHVLAQMPGEAIRQALENLPDTGPVTAMQFRSICNRAPGPDAPRLPEPVRPMPEAVRAAIDNAHDDWIALKRTVSPAEYTIRRIEHIVATRGGVMSSAQRSMIASCRTVTGSGEHIASPQSVEDRARTDDAKQATSDAASAYAAEHGIDLDAPRPSARSDRFWAAGASMAGAWGPGFGPNREAAA